MGVMTTEETPQQQAGVVRRKTAVMMGERGLAIETLDHAIRFAEGLIHGGMVPRGVKSPGAVVGLIEAGKELGLAPMYALSNLTFTNGRLGIMGDAAKALIRKAGALEPGTDFKEVYSGDPFTAAWTCTVSAHRKGQKEPFESSFSLGDAIVAKLIRLHEGKVQTFSRDGGWGDHSAPWTTYTKRLLMYRGLGFLVRDRFSDILGGAVLTEELRDYPQQDAGAPSATPPAEADPLLSMVTVTTDEPAVAAPQDAIDAEIVEETTSAVSDDEADAIRAIERLEGAIVTAESKEQLDRIWAEAAPLLAAVSVKQKKALSKLYEQNLAGFAAA